MKRLLAAAIAFTALGAAPAFSSTEFDLAGYVLRIVNDDDPNIYVKFDTADVEWSRQPMMPGMRSLKEIRATHKSICPEEIFVIGSHPANIYPKKHVFGTRKVMGFHDLEYKDYDFSSSIRSLYGKRYEEVIDLVYDWLIIPDEEKISYMSASANDKRRALNCIQAANAIAITAGYVPQRNLSCRKQGRKYRETRDGMMCLSDFEAAKLKAVREEGEMTRQLIQEESFKDRQNLQSVANEMMRKRALQDSIDRLRENQSVRCSGSVYAYGNNYATYTANCY